MSVIGVDNFDPFYSPTEKRANVAAALAHPRYQFVEADCAIEGDVFRATDGQEIDIIVHLGAKAGVRPSIADPAAYVRANIVGTQSMLELARLRRIRHFVFASSSSVYGDDARSPFLESEAAGLPLSPYAATKRAGELLCHTYFYLHGISILALRFFTVYGPRQRPDLAIRKFAELMLRGHPIQQFGDGSSARDYTWIDDIVDGVVGAILRSLTSAPEFEIINLGESRTTTLAHLIKLLGEALGITPVILRQSSQAGDVHLTCADISKARRLLGYSPSVTVEVGIPRFAEWFREHSVSK